MLSKQILHIAEKLEKEAATLDPIDVSKIIMMASEEFHNFDTSDDRNDFDDFLFATLENLQEDSEWDINLTDYSKEIGNAIAAARDAFYNTISSKLKSIKIKKEQKKPYSEFLKNR